MPLSQLLDQVICNILVCGLTLFLYQLEHLDAEYFESALFPMNGRFVLIEFISIFIITVKIILDGPSYALPHSTFLLGSVYSLAVLFQLVRSVIN